MKYSLWIKDYKPINLEDIYGNNFLIKIIKNYIENMNDIPNMILCGENGTGKKTLSKLIATKYQTNSDYILYIDASLYKNKDIINNKNTNFDVLSFSQQKTGDKCKIIIINNFDELQQDAQHSIRSIIEKYSKTTRFILTCNNINTITEPIQSRFLIFQIKKNNDKDIKYILNKIISSRDDLKLKPTNPELLNILNAIFIYTNGDIKSSINYLQMFSYTDEPTLEMFFKIFNIPSFDLISQIIEYTFDIKNLNKAYIILNKLFKSGHSPNDIIEVIIKILNNNDVIIKHKYFELISNIYIKMDIAPSEIQLINLIRKFSQINI